MKSILKRYISFFGIFALFFLLAIGVSAEISDLPEIEDMGFFLDTETGVWMDISNFQGQTYIDVESQLTGDLLGDFHIANKDEVQKMQHDFGDNPTWLRLANVLGHYSTVISGVYDDGDGDSMTGKSWKWQWQKGWTISGFESWDIYNDKEPQTGYWVVNPNAEEWIEENYPEGVKLEHKRTSRFIDFLRKEGRLNGSIHRDDGRPVVSRGSIGRAVSS